MTTEDRPELGSLIDALRNEKQMTELQIKSTLFLMYVGGSETTGTLLNYLLWQLGRHPEYQEEIYREMQSKEGSLFEIANSLSTVEKLFAESIRLFTPVYVIGRFPTKDMMCIVKDKEGENGLSRENLEKRGNRELSGPSQAAIRMNLKIPIPSTLIDLKRRLNRTLGIHLAMASTLVLANGYPKPKVAVFVTRLVQQFQIESFPKKNLSGKVG